jgi:5-methylcytosine-specific restriction endonuclease McrA
MREVKESERTTLLLNNAWQPIDTITARDAFRLCLNGNATALDKNSIGYHSLDSWMSLGNFHENQPALRSCNMLWPIPTMVVVTTKWFKRNRKKKLSLYELAKVCNNECSYCHEKFPLRDLTIDHVFPRCKGGQDVHENRVLSCGRCNRKKGDTYPWFDKYGNIPVAPPIPKLVIASSSVREEWEPFVIN